MIGKVLVNTPTQNTTKKLMRYSCPDIDCPIEGDSPELHCCQYCLHISDNEIKKQPQDWTCELPNREAQRRNFSSLDSKQQKLFEVIV